MSKTLKTVLAVVTVLILIVGAFFLGQYVSKEVVKDDNNVTEKNDGKEDNSISNKENKVEIEEKDIYESISEIKNNKEIEDLLKVKLILKKVFAYVNESYSDIYCTTIEDGQNYKIYGDEEYVCHYSFYVDEEQEGKGYFAFNKKMTYIVQDQVGAYSLTKEVAKKEVVSLDIWKDQLMREKYYIILEEELTNDGDMFSYIEKKYGISNDAGGACFGYSYKDGDDYFYINVSATPRSWYNYDSNTGICKNKIKDLVTYKFNIKTDKYEVIEK